MRKARFFDDGQNMSTTAWSLPPLEERYVGVVDLRGYTAIMCLMACESQDLACILWAFATLSKHEEHMFEAEVVRTRS